MSKIDETGKAVGKEVGSFLSDKPIWVWWIGYVLLTAVLFAIFYLAFYVLTLKWWIDALLIIVIGLIWATIAFFNKNPVKSKKPA